MQEFGNVDQGGSVLLKLTLWDEEKRYKFDRFFVQSVELDPLARTAN
jgi:hypothetical protein